MTIVEQYTGTGPIMACNGEVWVIDDCGLPITLGKIERIELAIEYPEEMLSICRVEHVMLYNEDDEELYEDQDIVDNAEYHSDEELLHSLAKQYGVSADTIDII